MVSLKVDPSNIHQIITIDELYTLSIFHMHSLTKGILIDFQNMPGTEEEKDYHKQVYSVIKLHLSEMEKYEKTSHFVSCKNCKMVLTQEDKESVYDWEEISSNEAEFKDVIAECREEQENTVVWICSFCENKNVLDCSEIKFAKNNSRVIERPAIQGNQKKDPILLIVFDISGSMEELLTNDQPAYSGLVERIKKTKIYQKIVAEEEKEIKELMEKQNIKDTGDAKTKYKDYLKKNKLLMGLTEWLINEISPNGNTGNQKMERTGGFGGNSVKKTKITKTIGFIFFNSNVILQFTNKDRKSIVFCDDKEGYCGNVQKLERDRVNFDDFEHLFKKGAENGHSYTTKINQFQFGNLQFKFGDSSHGQTALGPAIVMALGVVSQHGAGSSIVVVTDGIGNKGIFDQSQKWQQPQKLMKIRLEKFKCFLTMLQCRNINENNREKDVNNIKTCIDEFCGKNEDSIAKKINILVDKNKTADNLVEDIKKKMIASINRDNVIWTNQVIIKCQNPNVTFDDDMSKLTQKLHNQQTPTYIIPKFDAKTLKQKDYIHHFMTQAVIRYENTQTGEQSIFLTYILQKFIKFSNIKKQTMKKMDNQKTFHEMMEYLSVEEQNYDISNIPLSFVKKTFRDTLMFSKSIYNRSLRFPINSQNQNRQEDAAFFEQIYRRAENKTINEEDEYEDRL